MTKKNRNIIHLSFALLSIMSQIHFSTSSSSEEDPFGISALKEGLKKLASEVPAIFGSNGSLPFGSPKIGACIAKVRLVNPIAIEATQKSIRTCTEKVYDCSIAEKSKFRSIDGSCNNIEHPTWGKSENCLQRVLPFDYADGKSEPRISHSGKPLPNPRLVSNVFHRQTESPPKPDSTIMMMEWGQMVAHDLSLNDVYRLPESENNIPIDCCANGPVTNDVCMSYPIPPDDPTYNITCQLQVRTIPCSCQSAQRISSNQNTAFHDLSLIYGSTEERANELRSGDRGMLREEYNRKSGSMPPTVQKESECFSPTSKPACYHAGDPRINMSPHILTLQVIFFRLHNYICKKLSKVNPQWDDERVYQEARRINIAIAQFHTYKHYLPQILGEAIVKLADIQVLPGALYTDYIPELDPTITDEFTTVAARYGHTMIPANLTTVNPKTGRTKTEQLRNLYFTPFKFSQGMFDKVAKGMTLEKHEKHDRLLTDDIRSYLYRQNREGYNVGGDLAAVSIVRGRDHGIPGYTYYVFRYFGLIIPDFDALKFFVTSPKQAELLKSLYECVHDIDFYSLGIAANHVPGGQVGAVFAKALVDQYKHTKFGDRYWFEHKNQAGSFKPEQLVEIKKSTVANIICKTTKIKEIQKDPFLAPSDTNPLIPCSETHNFDFSLWKEENESQD